MKTKLRIRFFFFFLLTTLFANSQIYKNDFGTSNITGSSYTGTPTIDGNLSGSVWTTSNLGGLTSFVGSGGSPDKALAITLSASTTTTMTLTFNVNSGYYCNISSFSFWRQKSNSTGPSGLTMTINGTSVGSIANTPNSGSNTGTINTTGFNNLTGTVTILLSLTGGSSGGTFRVDDFTLNGSVTNTATTSPTDYFKSNGSGNWNSASTWKSSSDGINNWVTSSLVPDQNASSITISSGDSVAIISSASAGNLYVSSGAKLFHTSGISLSITNGNAASYDFTVDGTYILNGTAPTFSSSNCIINGTVRVDDNAGGQSDLFATVPDVVFATGAVYDWHTTQTFGTANTRYFRYSGSNIPIFRITKDVSGVGANSFTYFMGKFEVESGKTITFANGGTKYFRNGIGGDGTIIHPSIAGGGAAVNCGNFMIGDNTTTQTATIDGNIKIIVQGSTTTVGASAANTDFIIGNYTTVTISGSPTITIGTLNGITAGALMEVDGTLINNSSNPIDLTYGRLKVTGTLSSSSTGTFKCSSTFTRIISAGTTANTSVGVLKLTTGFNTVYSLEMGDGSIGIQASHRIVLGTDVIVANNIVLNYGIIVTDYKSLTWNNSGGSITLPTTYTNSFIATCDQNGNALVATGISPTTTTPFNGSVGFTIKNVKGIGTYTMFPIGYNFGRPSKIAINPNTATTTNITIVVTSGDVLNTPMARVNRIWYVYTSNTAANNNIGVRLYFTKYNWNTNSFGSGQDEIENGFDYTSVNVGRRDYTTAPRLSHRSAPKNVGSLDGTEAYAEYFADYKGPTWLPGYYKFAVGNFETIILPVSIINVKAYKSGNNINVEWSALHELNIDHYEVEHSSNGVAFTAISNTSAINNGSQQNNYTSTDTHPLNGNNFYRIKAIDKDGQVKYSSIVSVNMNSNYVGIKVLPNPVNNRLMNIQLSNLPAGKYDLLLYSANGQRVFTTSFAFSGGFSSQVVVLPPNIRTGAYILKLFNGTSKFTQNIMVE